MSNLFKFAENILNNLDQSTSTSIQSALKKDATKPSNSAYLSDSYESSFRSTTPTQHQQQQQLKPNASYSSFLQAKNNQKTKNQKKTKEDELIDFLNSEAKNENGTSNVTSATQSSPTSVGKDLMTRSLDVNVLQASKIGENNSNYNTSDNESVVNEDGNIVSQSEANDNVEFIVGGSSVSANVSDNEQQQSNNLNDTIRLNSENKKLKSELSSSKNEIKTLNGRIKQLEDEYQRSKRKVDHFQSQISESEKIIRELRAREEDMNESIKSKESQLAVLRVRYEECEKELKSRKTELETIKQESERILKDHTNSSDIQSQAFETLKDKLNEIETSLQREKDAYTNAQVNFLSKFEGSFFLRG